MRAETFRCHRCGQPATLTAWSERPGDPRLMDRYRLLAASAGWVIDLDGLAWCERHKPQPGEEVPEHHRRMTPT